MTNFSKKFLSLLENMRSSNYIMEDDTVTGTETKKEKTGFFGDRTSTGKSQRRSDKKETRLEDKFTKDDKFVIRAYIKAVDLLQGQVLATRIDIFNTIKNKMSGSKYGDPILRSSDTLLTLVVSLKRNAEKTAQSEGSRLEVSSNASEIESFRNAYSKYEAEYEEIQKKWNEAKIKEQDEKPVLAANQNIEKSLNVAKKFFAEAQADFTSSFSQFVPKKTDDKKDDSKESGNKTGGAEITSTIKQGKKSYTKEESDIIIDVKKTIYDKLNKATVYTSESFWKEVYKNYPNITAIFGPNTGLLIRALKKDFKLSDSSSSDINPRFYKEVKGFSIKESIDNNWGKIVSFESFMKSKINEENDGGGIVIDLSKSAESIEKAKDDKSTSDSGSKSTSKSKSSSSSGSSSGKSNVPADPATPFKTKDEGNKFREWVNKKYPDWAKENSLDASGSENNSYIRKAYVEYGEEYSKATSTPEVKKIEGKEMNTLLAKLKKYSSKVQLQLTTSTGEPVILFYSGKAYGHLYNNYQVIYTNTDGGKKQWTGTYDPAKEMVTFPGGKSWKLEYVVKCTITEGLSMDKETLDKVNKANELLVKMSDMIVAKFGDTGFWKPFKGRINDDEDAAVAAFSKWYGKTIEDAYYNPAINRIKQVSNSKAKTNLLKNTTEKNRFQFDKLINKLYGSSGTDNYKWTIYKSDGTTKSYSVDTDF
jgi:hypothetical protein